MRIIAGPCGAETESQIMTTAKFLANRGDVYAMRAGVWKPRSSGGQFEGVGEVGLKWLAEARNQFGIKVATEVGNAAHVEMALRYGVDILWIGARSSVNPFYVSEIAEAVRGTDVEVMVKNPINPDLKLWIGAIERFENVGVVNVSAVHRGFSTYGEKLYRNTPLWEIAIELKRVKPNICVIVDPSHIAGKRSLIDSVVKTSINYQMDGLMIEVHPNPNEAWSDKLQQLSFEEFDKLVNENNHTFRLINGATPLIERLRQEIDEIDNELIELLARRFDVSKRIGLVKNEEDMPILQLNRWDSIIKDRLIKGERLGLSNHFVKGIFDGIHLESLKTQNSLRIEKEGI